MDLNDFLSSAMSARSSSQQSFPTKNALLNSLNQKESPSPSSFRKPSSVSKLPGHVTSPSLAHSTSDSLSR